jgi:hypothetical protein
MAAGGIVARLVTRALAEARRSSRARFIFGAPIVFATAAVRYRRCDGRSSDRWPCGPGPRSSRNRARELQTESERRPCMTASSSARAMRAPGSGGAVIVAVVSPVDALRSGRRHRRLSPDSVFEHGSDRHGPRICRALQGPIVRRQPLDTSGGIRRPAAW